MACSVLAALPGAASAGVNVLSPDPSVPCGAPITLGVSRTYRGSHRYWAQITVSDRAGAVVYRKRLIAPQTGWTDVHVAPRRCGALYHVRYRTADYTSRFTVHVRPPATAARVASCPGFTISGTFTAWHVRRTSHISCTKAKNLIRAAYGAGPLHVIYVQHYQDSGRPTYWIAGGWRCGNGAGGAMCTNVRHPSWNEVVDYNPNGAAVEADTGER